MVLEFTENEIGSACDAIAISKEELQSAVMRAINKAVGEKSSVITV